ncbi:hypothetical protein BDQ17DRAFT_1435563 [Cyathus striatus]|nr:hypothetical protein BDQ17DRAFT_1435563 [Cyathus striatus]
MTQGMLGFKPKMTQNKTLKEWQVYQELYHNYIQDSVDTEWEEYCSLVPQDVKPAKSQSDIEDEVAQKHYDIEDDNTKTEVKAHLQDMQKSSRKDALKFKDKASHNKAYEKAIDRLPASINLVIEQFIELTGWNFTILGGGP